MSVEAYVVNLLAEQEKLENKRKRPLPPWLFVTFTLPPEVYDELEPQEQHDKFSHYIKRAFNTENVEYLCCPEFTKRLNIHYHALVRSTFGAKRALVKLKDKFGFIKTEVAKSYMKCRNYMYKDIWKTKEKLKWRFDFSNHSTGVPSIKMVKEANEEYHYEHSKDNDEVIDI